MTPIQRLLITLFGFHIRFFQSFIVQPYNSAQPLEGANTNIRTLTLPFTINSVKDFMAQSIQVILRPTILDVAIHCYHSIIIRL